MTKLIIAKLNEIKKDKFIPAFNKLQHIKKLVSNLPIHENLKLPDTNYWLFKQVEKNLISNSDAQNCFEFLCQQEYAYFEEWENENLKYVSRQYIGRTSSFNYLTDTFGEVLESETFNRLLSNESVSNLDIFGNLNAYLYDYMLDVETEETVSLIQNQVDENSEFLEEEILLIESILEDVELLEKITLEALSAYEYISKYKSNEIYIAQDFLLSYIENNIAENLAEKLIDKILNNINPLNKITYINAYKLEVDSATEIRFNSNLLEGWLHTINSNCDISNILSDIVVSIINYELNQKFDFQ